MLLKTRVTGSAGSLLKGSMNREYCHASSKLWDLINVFYQWVKSSPLSDKLIVNPEDGRPKGSRKNKFTFLALRFKLGLVEFEKKKAQ